MSVLEHLTRPRAARYALVALCLGMAWAGAIKPASAVVPPSPPYLLCSDRIDAAEDALTIPNHLLHAIGLVESGRWNAKLERRMAWPWTVYAQKRGRVFRTKAEAIAEVRRLQARGISNIDVGCMQVNLHYHGDAFESLDQALDPTHNVAYAAQLLKKHFQDTRSWRKAVSRYHSRTPKFARIYRTKVFRTWTDVRRSINAERRIVRMKLAKARRAARLRRKSAS